MNAYSDVRTLASLNYLNLEATQLTAKKAELRKILEAVSREIDRQTDRYFYCWEGAKYFDGEGSYFQLHDDLLSIDALGFNLDEAGDGTHSTVLAVTDYLLYPLNLFPKQWIKPSPYGNYGSFASNIAKGIEITGVWGYGDGLTATPYKLSGDAILDNPLAIGATVITVTAAENFGIGQTLRIDDEQVYITDLNDTTEKLTVRRAVNGTTAIAHVLNTVIYIYEYPADITEVCLIEAIRAASAGNWLDVTGSPETGALSVADSFHAKSIAIMERYNKLGW